MDIVKKYNTIKHEGLSNFTEKHSKFMGYANPTKTISEAVEFINRVKSINKQATHNVYAYSLKEENYKKSSDNGEPQGTAGIPILEILQKNKILNTTIVVSRYFGGTLLGVGGLIRSYSKAALLALESAQVVPIQMFLNVFLECSYDKSGKILSSISNFGGIIDSTIYSDKICIYFHIKEESFDALKKMSLQITSGKIEIKKINKSYY